MTKQEIEIILNKQREYFNLGETLNVSFRIEMLKRLKRCIKENEDKILEALRLDLGKPEMEAFMCEIGMVYTELTYMLRNVKKLSKKHRVPTPLSQFAGSSYTKAVPYGNTLIISPWNYPLLLTIGPLIDAIAAGNTCIVKPSEYSNNTSKLIKEMLEGTFDEKYIAVVTGGREENTHLLENKFDCIFFTGSQNVGKVVLRSAAENLTPVVLELGGKSPVIVDSTAKIKLAAKRIIFGKIINAGQTCVAPDYVLVDKRIKDKLIKELINEIKEQLGENALENETFGHIISKKHYDRVTGLIDKSKVIYGGNADESKLKIDMTIMDNVTFQDKVMGEEIFGPILPIISYDKFEDVYSILKDKQKPLALYIFSENKIHIRDVVDKIRFGGGCVNDTIIHLATDKMGFGGVGESGMGAYHGKTGFEAFSHTKSIMDKKTWMDMKVRYRPYSKKKTNMVRSIMK